MSIYEIGIDDRIKLLYLFILISGVMGSFACLTYLVFIGNFIKIPGLNRSRIYKCKKD